ncbi:MAG TPA: DUF6690 family protein [Pirellulales bacterium]|jgi:hypothetical protein|nr:DUF6690 family protein [Pirellulales bacterium]
MLGRKGFAVLLAGSIGGPYLLSTGVKSVSSLAGSDSTAQGDAVQAAIAAPSAAGKAPVAAPANAAANASAAVAGAQSSSLDEAPAVPMEEAFRLNLTTAWVLGHWPRVSAALADVDLQGYRTPLITGTQIDDLAGSLTYYFNKRQRVQRITFFGTTGDTRRLVSLLALRHGFVRELNVDPSLFLYRVRENRKVISELRIKPSSIVRADEPRTRFEVALLIERPETMEDK